MSREKQRAGLPREINVPPLGVNTTIITCWFEICIWQKIWKWYQSAEPTFGRKAGKLIFQNVKIIQMSPNEFNRCESVVLKWPHPLILAYFSISGISKKIFTHPTNSNAVGHLESVTGSQEFFKQSLLKYCRDRNISKWINCVQEVFMVFFFFCNISSKVLSYQQKFSN